MQYTVNSWMSLHNVSMLYIAYFYEKVYIMCSMLYSVYKCDIYIWKNLYKCMLYISWYMLPIN